MYRYYAFGPPSLKFGTKHKLVRDSIVIIEGEKYRVKANPLPTEERYYESVQLEVIEVKGYAIH